LVLHLLNGIEFNKPLDIFFEFVPRFLFLEAIFGYLCYMIFYKWGVDWIGADAYNAAHNITNITSVSYAGTSSTPVLLNELIYMFLPGGPTDDLYVNQGKTQTGLLLIALISIPFMFLPKPLILKYLNSKKTTTLVSSGVVLEADQKVDSSEESLDETSRVEETSKGKEKEKPPVPPSGGGHGHDEEEEFQFGELMIHQLLETIEFVLGSVSHTASYLRLWALSLAHSELATVFWQKNHV